MAHVIKMLLFLISQGANTGTCGIYNNGVYLLTNYETSHQHP